MAYVPEVDDFPEYLSEGAQITIHHSTHGALSATIIRPLRPRTVSHLVLAHLTQAADSCPLPIGLHFVVKVFDSRFIPHREPARDDIPWNFAAEQRGRELYRRDPMANPPTTAAHPQLNHPKYGDEDEGIPSEPDYVWERYYCAVMDAAFLAERSVYLRLSALQGTAVPIFYGDGVLDLSKTTPPRAYNPPVILIEYISNAVTLRDIDAQLLKPPVMQSMISAVDNINRNEVLLTDVNPGNFLFTPAHRPTRAVAIDFADARVRTFEDARYWEELIDMYWATPTVRRWMRRRFEKVGMSVPRLIQK